MTEWEADLLESTTGQLRRLARALGIVGDVEDDKEGYRPALLSHPSLLLDEDEQGALEVSPVMIADDCHDAIDELKTMVVLMNRLLIEAGADSEEAKGAIAESSAYATRMRDFPIRS